MNCIRSVRCKIHVVILWRSDSRHKTQWQNISGVRNFWPCSIVRYWPDSSTSPGPKHTEVRNPYAVLCVVFDSTKWKLFDCTAIDGLKQSPSVRTVHYMMPVNRMWTADFVTAVAARNLSWPLCKIDQWNLVAALTNAPFWKNYCEISTQAPMIVPRRSLIYACAIWLGQ